MVGAAGETRTSEVGTSLILHSILSTATSKLRTILVDGAPLLRVCSGHETDDSERHPLAGPERRPPSGRPIVARRNPGPAARPYRRGQYCRRRPRTRAAIVRDAWDIAHTLARSA